MITSYVSSIINIRSKKLSYLRRYLSLYIGDNEALEGYFYVATN